VCVFGETVLAAMSTATIDIQIPIVGKSTVDVMKGTFRLKGLDELLHRIISFQIDLFCSYIILIYFTPENKIFLSASLQDINESPATPFIP